MRRRYLILTILCISGCSCDDDDSCPEGNTCDDGDPCTRRDICENGTCVGMSPMLCPAFDTCHAAGVCDPSSGQCSNPKVPDGLLCNDADACTQDDVCLDGVCVGSDPVVCTAADQCHDPGTCDPLTGACSSPEKTDGTTCDDASACTSTDVCLSGLCTGTVPILCPTAGQCHLAGICDPATGLCSTPIAPDSTICDDRDPCTEGDTCQSGLCTGGTAVVCAALDACHVAGVCDPMSGCSNPPAKDGTTCDDQNACTLADSCFQGVCESGRAIFCAPTDQCHGEGICDPGTGLCSNPTLADGVLCDDTEVCTADDMCMSGVCNGAPCVGCTNLAAQQTTYGTATRPQFFTDNPTATLIDLDHRADGTTPVAGTNFDSDEFIAQGVRIRLETMDPTARLIWAGNPVGGFGARLACSDPLICTADIVVEFSAPKRAVGFDYPGNVQGVWKDPNGMTIYDSGNVNGSGDNFLGLTSTDRISSVTLIRAAINQLSGLAFDDCASTCGPGGELCF